MIMAAKAALIGAAALMTGGATTMAVCTCPPPETISCVAGHASFAAAKCSLQVLPVPNAGGDPPAMVQETLICPTGENAISGGYRSNTPDPLAALHHQVFVAAPFAVANGHPAGFQNNWRGDNGAVWKIYVTCEPFGG